MYLYDDFDRTLVDERVREFRDQVARRLSGELTEEEFKPLRLMNGVYLQLHAYMLRIAIPYGTLSSEQMRTLAHVARRYDRNYGHFTTRQNIQFNWIKLEELPDAMADLARAGMHGMQTSGNCVRNITTDQWAGVAPGEIEDPRLWAELLRQHLTLHPEFSFLPRKFKIALTASAHDRAAVRVHDIGLRLHRNGAGETGFEVIVAVGSDARRSSARPSSRSCPSATSSATSRRSCAPTISMAGATISTKRASRSSCTNSARKNSAARWKRNGSRSRTARLRSIPPWSPRSPRGFVIPTMSCLRTIRPS